MKKSKLHLVVLFLLFIIFIFAACSQSNPKLINHVTKGSIEIECKIESIEILINSYNCDILVTEIISRGSSSPFLLKGDKISVNILKSILSNSDANEHITIGKTINIIINYHNTLGDKDFWQVQKIN